MRNKFRTRRKSYKKTAAILVAGLLVLLVTIAALDKLGVVSLSFLPFRKDKITQGDDPGIKYTPPTEEEKEETENFKKDQASESDVNQPNTSANSQTNKKSVTPIMSSWGYNNQASQAEVSGYISGLIESNGTCTLKLQQDSQEVIESKEAIPDAKNTTCGLITISRDRLSSGTWTATLSYSSPSSEGTSQSVTLEVE